MNTKMTTLAAIAAMLTATLAAAQTQGAPQAAPAVVNCTMSDGLIEKTRTCQHLDPGTLELRFTQTCKLTRTIWNDRLELVGCTIARAETAPPAVPTTPPATTSAAQPCR